MEWVALLPAILLFVYLTYYLKVVYPREMQQHWDELIDLTYQKTMLSELQAYISVYRMAVKGGAPQETLDEDWSRIQRVVDDLKSAGVELPSITKYGILTNKSL